MSDDEKFPEEEDVFERSVPRCVTCNYGQCSQVNADSLSEGVGAITIRDEPEEPETLDKHQLKDLFSQETQVWGILGSDTIHKLDPEEPEKEEEKKISDWRSWSESLSSLSVEEQWIALFGPRPAHTAPVEMDKEEETKEPDGVPPWYLPLMCRAMGVPSPPSGFQLPTPEWMIRAYQKTNLTRAAEYRMARRLADTGSAEEAKVLQTFEEWCKLRDSQDTPSPDQ